MLAPSQPRAPSSAPVPASVVVERPPPGPLRGRFAVQPWVLVVLFGLVALLVIGFYGARFYRARLHQARADREPKT